eukprot:Lithocolla_globosa_v1_NODE_1216_length_2774_cov_8.362633.p4 type:complete len:104 gc:universal NODE_1216_length_2774_cov_8.362633:1445-1134(-)
MRTWLPSSIRDPNAKASAVPQSMPSPASAIATRCLKIFCICRCNLKPSGTVPDWIPILRSSSTSTPVGRIRLSCEGLLKPLHLELNQSVSFFLYVLLASKSFS